jgi:hypothetical protein
MDLCFNACFSQLEPKPPSGGQTEIITASWPLVTSVVATERGGVINKTAHAKGGSNSARRNSVPECHISSEVKPCVVWALRASLPFRAKLIEG